MKNLQSKNNKSKNYELFLRKSAHIKSRQWWQKYLFKIRRLLYRYLPNQKLSLFKSASFTLLITDNKEIQDLNKRFRKQDRTTDVLSFPLIKNEQRNKRYLGDIVISHQKAKHQATNEKKSIEYELLLLFIHGYLHLLGYDHKTQKQEKLMFSLQNKILEKINVRN